MKFIFYGIFIVVYLADLNQTKTYYDEEEFRTKNFLFYTYKGIESVVQGSFLAYEIIQMRLDFKDYLTDVWNYLELLGIVFWAWAAVLDILESDITNLIKTLFSLSIMFSLIKIMYLIRVFRQLNFLVTMFNTVVIDIFYFMILFCIFMLIFAQSFHVVGLSVKSYGRTPSLLAHSISVFRVAMGDFAMIDMNQGLDLIDGFTEDGDPVYRHSNFIMVWTFFIFVICIFFMFMIFMNFIIAVIGESYSKVIMNKDAFDYQQRAVMIFEREALFS